MFTPGSSVHTGQFSDDASGSDNHTQNPHFVPVILRDERRSHAAEIVAEMRAHAVSHHRADLFVSRLSRFAGIGLFALSLGGVGWTVADWL
ncbi:MAG TPA: hypothetical protein VF475_05010 [Sphingobium sp.]